MEGLDESLHSQPCLLFRSRSLLFLLQLPAALSYMYGKKSKPRMLLLCIKLVCTLHGTFLVVCIVNCTILFLTNLEVQ